MHAKGGFRIKEIRSVFENSGFVVLFLSRCVQCIILSFHVKVDYVRNVRKCRLSDAALLLSGKKNPTSNSTAKYLLQWEIGPAGSCFAACI
jgi:hypothetical protein